MESRGILKRLLRLVSRGDGNSRLPHGFVAPRGVRSPLTKEMLRPLPAGRQIVQFSGGLRTEDYKRLSAWLEEYPDAELRAIRVADLEFLQFFPRLRRFRVDSGDRDFESLAGLEYLRPDLDELGIGWNRRRLDLAVLARFGQLTTLYLDGLEGGFKAIDVVSRLTSLEDLTLRSITLPDLSVLVPLRNLLSLDIKLGGTSDLALLGDIGQIRYLELWRIRGLTDLSPIGRMRHLRYLYLQALGRAETLPALSRAHSLRRVHLESMTGLHDLGPLATAPALRQVLLIDMPHLKVESLAPLKTMPQLEAVALGLGSFRRNDEARAFLGLPDVETLYDWQSDEFH